MWMLGWDKLDILSSCWKNKAIMRDKMFLELVPIVLSVLIFAYFLVQTIIVHVFQVLHPTDSFGVGFLCSYSEFKTFLDNERNCPYLLTNLRDHCTKDVQLKNVTCMVFFNAEDNFQITSAQIKFYSYGVRYKLDLKSTPCNHTDVVKTVNVTLICEHKTVIDGKLCRNNAYDSCDTNNEICQQQGEVKENLCIQIQHLYEPCDDYSPCERNTECKQSNGKRTCQCLQGYDVKDGRCIKGGLFLNDTCDIHEQCTGKNYAHCSKKGRNEQSTCQCIDRYVQINATCFKGGVLLGEPCYDNHQCTGTDNTHCSNNNPGQQSTCQCIDGYVQINSTCFKGNRHVYESCVWPEQCTGSYGANQCKYVEGFKMCYCSDGYGLFNGVCLKAGVPLGQPCYLREQCDGAPNSTICAANKDNSMQLSCECNSGFIQIKNSCLRGDKGLYEGCEADSQCSGESGNMVCRDTQNRKLCFCNAGFVEDRDSLKCRKAWKEKGESCKINQQCNGTENANTCHFGDNVRRGECACNRGFDWIDRKCLKVGRFIYEQCDHQDQCTGTINANNCTDFGNKTLCYCNMRYIGFQGKCIKDNKILGESCDADIQCSGTDFAAVCGYNGTCLCAEGFIRLQMNCSPVGRQIFETCDHPDQCNGTENANLCSAYGTKRICYCNPGYLEFKGACFQGDKKLGESCKEDIQCNGTLSLVCGEDLTCSCNKGFIRMNETCLQVHDVSTISKEEEMTEDGNFSHSSDDWKQGRRVDELDVVTEGVSASTKRGLPIQLTSKQQYFFVQTVIVHLFQILRTTDSFPAGFLCSYSEFKTFLDNERNCPYLLTNVRDRCTKDVQLNNDTCMVFPNSDINDEEITSAQIKFYFYGVRYKFDLKARPCNHRDVVKTVNVTLICEHKTVIDGKVCTNNDRCNRNKEICRRQDEVMEHLCIRKLFLKDICNEDEQCTGTANAHCSNKGRNELSTCQCIDGYIQINSSCFKGELLLNDKCNDDQQCTATDNAHCSTNKGPNQQSTCQCINGYLQINSTCFKANRHIYESCVWPEQCTGSHGANQCRYVEGFKMCYCSDRHGVFNGVCLEAGVSLGHACYLTEQCDGELNSTVCVPNKDGSMELSCQCNSGFIEINQNCLQADKGLYKECEVDDQCNGDSKNMVCREKRRRKLCFCDAGFVEDREFLKCRKAGKEVNDSCQINEQCNGTKNANTCHFEDFGNAGICTCNHGFEWIDRRCLKVERLIFEPCNHPSQCNGTKNANTCKTFGNQRLCYCDQGYLEFQGNCLKVNKTIGESCEADIQCSGTDFAAVCGNNGTCSCSKGFIRLQQKCLPAEESWAWINDKDNQFLLIAGAGCFGTIVFFFTTLLLALKRNKSRKMRLNCQCSRSEPMRNVQYPMTESSSSTNIATRRLICSEYAYSDPIEDNYCDTRQEETKNENGNVNTSAQHQSSYRTQDSENMLYSYNNIHEEHPEMLEGLYNSSIAVSLSTFTGDK